MRRHTVTTVTLNQYLREPGTAVTANTDQIEYDVEVLHRDARVLRTTCNRVCIDAETSVTTVTPIDHYLVMRLIQSQSAR